MIGKTAGVAVVAASTPLNKVFGGVSEGRVKLKGNIHHSVSQCAMVIFHSKNLHLVAGIWVLSRWNCLMKRTGRWLQRQD